MAGGRLMHGRFELKFVVDAASKTRFLDAVRDKLGADPHGENAVYRVSSLYFDTPDYDAVIEKLDGESVRRKYRLRYYTVHRRTGAAGETKGVSVADAFMEIKHRIRNTVYKQRTRLTDAGAARILEDARQLQYLSGHVVTGGVDPVLIDEVERVASQRELRAATVITYLREAWLGTIDHRLRVTFDSHCQAYSPRRFGEVHDQTGTPVLDPGLLIMEIKFDHAIPCWIRDVLVSQQLRLQRFSKYASGILNKPEGRMASRFRTGPVAVHPHPNGTTRTPLPGLSITGLTETANPASMT
jgi:hypothetical protein